MSFLETVQQDFAFAFRNLHRTPGFTATVVATLALGIGANTAIFSAVNTLLLRPLPFTEPDRLMKLTMIAPARDGGHGGEDMVWSFPKYAALKAGQTSYGDLAIYTSFPYTMLNEGGAERVQTELVNRGYLATLGIAPFIGRNISAEEDAHPDGPKVVMISASLWGRSFNRTPDVLNRTVTLDGEPYSVIGVLPDNFRGVSGAADLWVSIMTQDAESLNEAEAYSYSVIGRLRPGVTPSAARAEVEGLGVRINRQFPPEIASEQWGSTARPLDGTRVDPFVRQSLLVLFGATLLVLLIACANVANLFLVRGESRRREMAVRLAMGAGRGRLVRQLLSESLLLSVVGAVSGLVVAWAAVRYLSTLDNAAAIQSTHSDVVGAVNFAAIHLDPAALAFTILVALATGLIFGLWPAVRATRTSMGEVLKEGRVHPTGQSRLMLSSRSLLSVMEIALALVLLAGAGLMIRSLGKLLAVDQGFVADGVLTLRLNSADGMPRDSLPGFFDRLLMELGALPGATGVALTDCAPLGGGCNGTIMALRDRPESEASSRHAVGVHWVTPEWFGVAGVPLSRGRGFAAEDRVGARKVVIVNQTAARTFWPGEDPIGKSVSVGQGGFWPDTAYVVGVVGDVRYGQVQDRPAPEAYLSYFQSPRGRMMVFLKTRGDPVGLAGPARAAIQRLSPGSPVYAVRTFKSLVEDGLGYVRMSTTLLTLFAGLALGLATLGAYGVMAYTVQGREKELGIRVALGATGTMMVRLVAGQGARLGLIGGTVGLAAALLLTGLLRSQLYGVEPNDPSTLLRIGLVLAVAMVIAGWIPAWRAARVDPMQALRSE